MPDAMATAAAVIRLLTRPRIPMSMRLGPEDREAVVFADALRAASLAGRLKGVWCHCANEGKRHQLTALLLRGMGLLSGAPDYWFVWPNGGGLIELKTGRNKPTAAQIDFASWAALTGVRHATVWSAAEGLAVLAEWGVLSDAGPRRGPTGALLPERAARRTRLEPAA